LPPPKSLRDNLLSSLNFKYNFKIIKLAKLFRLTKKNLKAFLKNLYQTEAVLASKEARAGKLAREDNMKDLVMRKVHSKRVIISVESMRELSAQEIDEHFNHSEMQKIMKQNLNLSWR
jgi:hypothetical protein